MKTRAARWWRFLRTLADDDAYDRYCEHQRRQHPDQAALDRRAFYLQRQQNKWSGVNRCC